MNPFLSGFVIVGEEKVLVARVDINANDGAAAKGF